jgi:hypothetical protein
MGDWPTIYESHGRRRAGRVRRRFVVAVVATGLVAALGAALLALRQDTAGRATGEPVDLSSSPSPIKPSGAPARLGQLADVEVHQGETTTFRCRIVEARAPAAVTLVVTNAAGDRVKARRLDEDVAAGEWLEATVRVDLPPGRYTCELQLGRVVTSAELRVLAPLPPGFPGAKAVAAAEEWVRGRDGEAAFAVVDTNGEPAGGYRAHEPFQLASLSKAILLVASLRADPTPDAATEATLTRMIAESDNGAASTIFSRVGAKGMRAVARAAELEDYEQGAGWLDTRDSAADQASFFHQLESLVPAAGRSLARRLLADVVPIQRWGIPAAAGPEGWTSYHKSGWLGLDNRLMVQAAWLEKGNKKWALSVVSDENPTSSYGWDTQKGVAGLLLGQEPTPAYLAVVLE